MHGICHLLLPWSFVKPLATSSNFGEPPGTSANFGEPEGTSRNLRESRGTSAGLGKPRGTAGNLGDPPGNWKTSRTWNNLGNPRGSSRNLMEPWQTSDTLVGNIEEPRETLENLGKPSMNSFENFREPPVKLRETLRKWKASSERLTLPPLYIKKYASLRPRLTKERRKRPHVDAAHQPETFHHTSHVPKNGLS